MSVLEDILSKAVGSALGGGDADKEKIIQVPAEIGGGDEVKKVADQIGMPEDQTADLLAKALPMAVDQASPDGDEPAADQVESILRG